jgi:hypothetical protein
MQTRGPGGRGRKEEQGAGRQDEGDEGGAASAPPSRPGRRRWRDSSCWFARPRTATETRMGRFGLVLAFCLSELMVMSLAQNSTTPYIAGLWEFVSRGPRHQTAAISAAGPHASVLATTIATKTTNFATSQSTTKLHDWIKPAAAAPTIPRSAPAFLPLFPAE